MNLVWKGLVKLKNNDTYREDLLISYLDMLAKQDNKDEFLKFYSSIESQIRNIISSSQDINLLSRINSVLAYRKNSVELGVVK